MILTWILTVKNEKMWDFCQNLGGGALLHDETYAGSNEKKRMGVAPHMAYAGPSKPWLHVPRKLSTKTKTMDRSIAVLAKKDLVNISREQIFFAETSVENDRHCNLL